MLPKVVEALKKAKKLRTVFVCEQRIGFDIGNAFKQNKRLRVLDLNESAVNDWSYFSSMGGGDGLKHLRYLQFLLYQHIEGEETYSSNGLPPLSMAYLPLPKRIGRSRFLQTLPMFNLGDKEVDKNACGIEELEGLNLLRGDLIIKNLQNVTSKTDACGANLKEKKNLRSLQLMWFGAYDDPNYHEAVLEGLQPHPNLRTLKIKGYQGTKLPRWMGDSSCIPNLVELKLSGNDCEQLVGFGGLPSLRYLTLEFMVSLKEWVVPPPPPQATTNYCFPLLEEITIWYCHQLTTITPATTTTISPCLKVLNLCIINGSAVEILVTNHLNSLTSLRLIDISNLVSLPRQGLMENNNTLLSLHIEGCQQFEGFFPPYNDDDQEVGGQQLQQISQQVSSSSCSSSSLQSLKLYNCPALRVFPDIHSLTSLRNLEISSCKKFKSLQGDLTCLSSSLKHLEHVKLL